MIEQKRLKIRDDSGTEEGSIEFTATEPWEIRLMGEAPGTVDYSCAGSDLFECLALLRSDYLESNDVRLSATEPASTSTHPGCRVRCPAGARPM